MFTRLLTAMSSELPFKLAYKRLSCMEKGHTLDGSVLIDKLTSEKHPNSSEDLIYTVNLFSCGNCGLTFQDSGVEFRCKNF